MIQNPPTSNNDQTSPQPPGLAIASLVLGIFSFIGGGLLLLPPILAVVFGHTCRSKCKKKNVRTGMDLALAGLILGYISLCIFPIQVGLMAAMAVPAFQEVREVSHEKMILNNLRMIAATSDQYFLENNVEEVRLDQIIGEDSFIKVLNYAEGEKYPEVIRYNDPFIEAVRPNGENVKYQM